MFTRKRTFQLDGVELQISPLTAVQAENHLRKDAALIEEFRSEQGNGQNFKPLFEKRQRLILELIMHGLNNASPEMPVTVEQLKAEADNVLIDKLQEAIMELSGLRYVTPESPPGEK
ncbi:MAG TPA: hypothetical protein VJW77_02350 [Terriglobia bacterium]|nr:hypothetical protein [Terriglobia bacterium]